MSINTTTGGTPARGGEFTLADPVNSFIATVTRVATVPAAFFRSIRKVGDLVSPLVFALICFVIGALLSGIFGFLFALVGIGPRSAGAALVALIGGVILGPIILAVILAILAGLFHLLVILIVKPANSGFEATFRATAYTFPLISLVSWIPIPVLGLLITLIALVYSTYLSVVGIRELHSTTMRDALLVVLIPVGILLALGICLALTVGLAIVALLSGASS